MNPDGLAGSDLASRASLEAPGFEVTSLLLHSLLDGSGHFAFAAFFSTGGTSVYRREFLLGD